MAKRGGLKRQHLAASKAENANEEPEPSKSPKKRRMTTEESTDFGTYLDTERLRGFKCPKKAEDAPHVENVSLNKPMYLKEIKPILERSFKAQESYQAFVVKQCCHLRNKQHEQEYTDKRTQLRQNAHTPKEMKTLNDYYGFVFAKNKNQIVEWCKEGLSNGNAAVSHLGESSSGVSLSQFVDLVCPTNLLPKEGWICIVKYFKGRAYHVPPSSSPLEPQPGYDCHLTNSSSQFSSGRLKENDDVALSNQIFLFEYNEDAELLTRPRHVLPFAAVQYNFEMSASAALQTRDTNDPKMNRILLQKERMNQMNEAPAKTYLNNRQHPGVPLTEVKPRPPLLGCRTTQDLLSAGGASVLRTHSTKGRRAKEDKKSAVEPPAKATGTTTAAAAVAEDGPKRAGKKKEEPPPVDKPEEPAAEPSPEPAPPAPRGKAKPAPNVLEGAESAERAAERPAPNVGKEHFSGGFVVSVVRLKVGTRFQGKMDLVSYADKIVYPVAVRCRRLAPKLAVRAFISMSSLLANELAGVKISLKEEFMLSDRTHYGSYYRFYLRPSAPSLIPLSYLIEYMRKRQKVAAVCFPTGNKEILMFPDGNFANDIGIPPITKSSSTQSTLFLHCLFISDTPRHNYYTCLREPVVSPEMQCVDEVLSSYIWADADLPPVDEEAAQLQGSYGGVWPCVEALTQVLSQMNEIQSKRFRHLVGKAPEGSERLYYQPLDFTRQVRPRIQTSPAPASELERISELISKKELQEVLANVELLEQQKHLQHKEGAETEAVNKQEFQEHAADELEVENFEEEDVKERIGDWRHRKKDIHCGLGNIFRSVPETPSSPPPVVDCESHGVSEEVASPTEKQPQMVRYSKTVFEEPPSSPTTGPSTDCRIKREAPESDSSPNKASAAMTTQLARINAEMKEPDAAVSGMCGSADQEPLCYLAPNEQQSDSSACFGKMLNVIRNSMYDNRSASKDGVESEASPTEPAASFDGYDIQNRAAKAARERAKEGDEDTDGSGAGHGINDWYWDYYRKSIAKSDCGQNSERPKSPFPMPTGWARKASPPLAGDRSTSPPDINDDEIHRILEQGLGLDEARGPGPKPQTEAGNCTASPASRRDLRFLRLSSAASGSPASGSQAGPSSANQQSTAEEPTPKRVAQSPSSSMSISDVDDAEPNDKGSTKDADKEGSHIPVMVNRRLPSDAPTSQSQAVPSTAPRTSPIFSCLVPPPPVPAIPIPLIPVPIGNTFYNQESQVTSPSKSSRELVDCSVLNL